MEEKLTIEVITHYPITDPECYGDYWDIEMLINGDLLLEFGDFYHDKGQEKIAGILSFLDIMSIEYVLEESQIADR